jgi:SRSO17 transposase
MTDQQIHSLGPALAKYLREFAGCFPHPNTRGHLGEYVEGQLSNLPRKSVEPMAHRAGVAPRTLQEFLSLSDWDEEGLRDRVQRIVARDHGEPEAIGIIDESGHPKKGAKTACVQRQYCGTTGKIDNCVMTVHLSYASYDTRFHTMLDSTLYLPETSWSAPDRRQAAGIPDAVVYRSKYQIGLEQLDRATGNGVRFGWITADEWYGEKPRFVAGLEERGERFVLEIPRNVHGWLVRPRDVESRRRAVETLCRYSRPMLCEPWRRFHVKDSDKGAIVWEAKAAPFWMHRGDRIVEPYWLVIARNVLDPREVKYFLSNAAPGTPLETILHVAFSRWPVERCLRDEKTELGLSHFEVRTYGSIVRHLLLTVVSHLFLTRQTQGLRGKKPGDHDLPGSPCCRWPAGRVVPARGISAEARRPARGGAWPRAATERQGASLAHQNASGEASASGNSSERSEMLHSTMTAVAL